MATTFATLHSSTTLPPEPIRPNPSAELMAAPRTIISVTTGLIGSALTEVLPNGPSAPKQTPVMWGLLAWVRRQLESAFRYHPPTATPAQTEQIDPPATMDVTSTEGAVTPAVSDLTVAAADPAPVSDLVVDTVSEPLALTAAAPENLAANVPVATEDLASVQKTAADPSSIQATVAQDPAPVQEAVTGDAAPMQAEVAAAAPVGGGVIFFEANPRIGEANGTVTVPIVRTGDLTGLATIEYGITPDTATDGVDYLGGNGTITMDVGVDRVFIPVQILNDNVSESTETFVVSIINVEGATLLFPRTARIDILDDENPIVDPPSPPLTSNYIVTEQVIVSGLNQPLSFEFAPQDPSLVYVAEKGGVIKVFNVDTGAQQSTFIDISSKVNDNQDRGLLDIVLHPNFGQPVEPGQPEHNYVYAFYVVDPPDTVGNPDPNAGPDGGGNRFAYLVRFTADAATNYTTAVPGSEVIMLGGVAVPGVAGLQPRTLQDISGTGAVDSTTDGNQPESGFNAATGEYVDNYLKVDARSHAGGSLAFSPLDGALYVSVGDGISFNMTDPRGVSVQNVDSLSGKILRIDPVTGLGLADNPFVEPGDDLSVNRAKVYQLGLRNPFSMGFTQDGRLFMTNTGWDSWEEIESGHAGANFGWPYFEGGDNGVLSAAPGYQNLPGDPARNLPSATEFYAAVANGTITVTPAYRAFAHDENAPGFQLGAIVGFDSPYTGSQYPAEFQNDIFFTDVNTGHVFVIDVNDRSDVKFLYSTEGYPVSFSQGPDGYVYVANLAGSLTRLLIEPIPDPPPPPPPPNITLMPHGSASVANDVYTLTTAGSFEAGTAMSTGRIDVRQDFIVVFEVNLGASDAGADGAAIVFHNDPRGA
ncbi:PQQ-dependent sugar dehydrogenase, partial [Mycolicibacterium sp. CR10]|uniref:PQQ-dependent sugar dehydrogenase n=1 Tax=Mycolicibacterium sp. CR10 TaxID=2562314 RepID=UPI00197B4241